ncbi:TetR/AcrR family transcriptional regulator [Streptomyces davaonensis]|uniref:TetR/AcrR family transcriptional regulator n=1 Tax=Streptomyces davaonensis TaxID=348043 RepID=UPI00034498AB|nr:TetR family transcriptional regulator [Streptomyces davaonensis]
MDANAGARRGRPPKGTSQLSRAAIVDATLKVIDTDGVTAVSMRSVARVLGVDAKSLYNHVDGKDGLLDAVAEHLLGGVSIPPATGDLRIDLPAIADAFRERALLHPEAAPLVLTRQLASFEGLAPVEALLGVLRSAGCPVEESVQLMRFLVASLIGTLLREVQAGPTFGISDKAGIATRQNTLEDSGLPHVIESAPRLARFDRDAEYEYTVQAATALVLERIRASQASTGVREDRPAQKGQSPTKITKIPGSAAGTT